MAVLERNDADEIKKYTNIHSKSKNSLTFRFYDLVSPPQPKIL